MFRCDSIENTFGFSNNTLSKEEEDFPLAFGLLVYKWIDEVNFL